MNDPDDGLWGIVALVFWALLLLALEWIDEHTEVSE